MMLSDLSLPSLPFQSPAITVPSHPYGLIFMKYRAKAKNADSLSRRVKR